MKLQGTAGLVFYADILVPVFGTSKLAQSNARVAVKICIDRLCSLLVTDRRDPLPRTPTTVHILNVVLPWACIHADGLSVGKKVDPTTTPSIHKIELRYTTLSRAHDYISLSVRW